jgi:hypothetical protein
MNTGTVKETKCCQCDTIIYQDIQMLLECWILNDTKDNIQLDKNRAVNVRINDDLLKVLGKFLYKHDDFRPHEVLHFHNNPIVAFLSHNNTMCGTVGNCGRRSA